MEHSQVFQRASLGGRGGAGNCPRGICSSRLSKTTPNPTSSPTISATATRKEIPYRYYNSTKHVKGLDLSTRAVLRTFPVGGIWPLPFPGARRINAGAEARITSKEGGPRKPVWRLAGVRLREQGAVAAYSLAPWRSGQVPHRMHVRYCLFLDGYRHSIVMVLL